MQNNYSTYYELLGVAINATSEEIQKAQKTKVIHYHPDRNGGGVAANFLLSLINNAREVLTDPAKRIEYDYMIGGRRKPEPPPRVIEKEVQVPVEVRVPVRDNSTYARKDFGAGLFRITYWRMECR